MANEFIIIGGIILVGLIFFLVTSNFFSLQGEELIKAKSRSEAEEILSLIERISKDPAKFLRYSLNISLSNISVSNKIFSYESKGYKFSYLLTSNVSNVELKEITEICIVKQYDSITISDKCPSCNYNFICEIDECTQNCDDCKGPANICIGDKYCNNYIENCANSPSDCNCAAFGANYICCPEDPKANEFGCVGGGRRNLDKGEECYCHNQCKAGLECNPTTPDFTAYPKACCEPGKNWNGSECVTAETFDAFDVFVVPVQIDDQNTYFSIALEFKNHFLSVSPFRECRNRDNLVKFWIINISDCPDEAASRCWDHCSDCINIGRRCARKMEGILGVSYDKFAVLTTGGGWLGGCACDIPCDGSSSSLISCSFDLCVPSHEIGHDLGLGHVNCRVACHACMVYPPNPNCPDCGHPDRATFIMDYCRPMQRYGPAAYDFLSNGFVGTPPNAAGLGKWMRECIR